MGRRDLCKENNCTRTDTHTHPLPLPLLTMRQWHIVWPGEPWVQPIDPNTGLVADTETPMCRFCRSIFDYHTETCVGKERP